MDLYRQATAAGGALKLAGVQKRVETMLTMTGAQNFLEIHADEAVGHQELRGVAMRTIKTTTGAEITLDGDLLAVMETLYREVTARRELERSFEDMVREITHLIDQMDEDERRTYLLESLFLNTVKYENDKLEAYMRKISEVGTRSSSAQVAGCSWPRPVTADPASTRLVDAARAAGRHRRRRLRRRLDQRPRVASPRAPARRTRCAARGRRGARRGGR